MGGCPLVDIPNKESPSSGIGVNLLAAIYPRHASIVFLVVHSFAHFSLTLGLYWEQKKSKREKLSLNL